VAGIVAGVYLNNVVSFCDGVSGLRPVPTYAILFTVKEAAAPKAPMPVSDARLTQTPGAEVEILVLVQEKKMAGIVNVNKARLTRRISF
jgi:hypothetical protein